MPIIQGKTIRIYLVDGVPTGVLVAELSNWTGKVLVAPRAQLADLTKREETKRTGVYCLVGPDPESPHRDRVYVGETDYVASRLAEHDKDDAKDFWTRTLVIISKDENLTKAHVRYLESRLIHITKQAARASLANGTAPLPPSLPEPDVADMEFFIDHVQMMLPVLGMMFLHPVEASSPPEGDGGAGVASPEFIISQTDSDVHAVAYEVGGEIIVQKGSTARKQGVPSWDSYVTLRNQLMTEGRLVDHDNPSLLIFGEDVAFSSPSAAACVVLGRNSNGRLELWIQATGETYADWRKKLLEESTGE